MATPEDRLAAYFDTTQPRRPFDDRQIDAVALLLARCSHATERSAARSPRTYITFRSIGRLDLLPQLLSEGFGDDWFPVTLRGLPGFLDPRVKADILQNQQLILTKSLDLENGQHCKYGSEEQRPFDVHSYIGSGSFGQVRVVESRVTYKQYALKTIRRKMIFGTKSKEIMGAFNTEMEIMKRLRHEHVVRYVGSYTDSRDLGLLMSPVADCDLGAYLEEACKTPKFHPTLRTFFGCLATALSYLHDEGIKHRDIKPQNVLVHKANVLLADFGISRDFLDTTTGSTTTTLRYCSPEVAAYEGRNASADVWSLGCVFLEMQSALQTKSLSWLKAYYEANGTGSTNYHTNTQATEQLLEELRAAVETQRMQPLVWIEKMLATKRQDRPTSAEVMNWITASDSPVGFMYSCSQCCHSYSESESVRGLEDEWSSIGEPGSDSNNKRESVDIVQPTVALRLTPITSSNMVLARRMSVTDDGDVSLGKDRPSALAIRTPTWSDCSSEEADSPMYKVTNSKIASSYEVETIGLSLQPVVKELQKRGISNEEDLRDLILEITKLCLAEKEYDEKTQSDNKARRARAPLPPRSNASPVARGISPQTTGNPRRGTPPATPSVRRRDIKALSRDSSSNSAPLSISVTGSDTREEVALLNIKPTPQSTGSSLTENEEPGSDDLYMDQETFNKSPYKHLFLLAGRYQREESKRWIEERRRLEEQQAISKPSLTNRVLNIFITPLPQYFRNKYPRFWQGLGT